MKKLQETGTLMLSDDYKERFKAEYWQTKFRYEKLKKHNTEVEASQYMSEKNAADTYCIRELFRQQQSAMGEYLHILEIRAVIEGIDLDD